MRIASIVAVFASTLLVCSFATVAAEAQDALVVQDGNETWASSSDASQIEDSSRNEDPLSDPSPFKEAWASSGDSSSNEDASNDGSGVDEKPTPTPTQKPCPHKPTPAPTEKPTSKPAMRAVHIHIKQHTPRVLESLCSANEDEMSVEGVERVFCVKKAVGCGGERAWGKCPGRQTGLPHGSYCGRVASGVFGCKPGMPYGEVPDWDDVEDKDNDGSSSEANSGSGEGEASSTDGSGSA